MFVYIPMYMYLCMCVCVSVLQKRLLVELQQIHTESHSAFRTVSVFCTL